MARKEGLWYRKEGLWLGRKDYSIERNDYSYKGKIKKGSIMAKEENKV